MASDETRYTNKIFMAAALPLMKTIATDVPELKKKFEGVNAIYQVSAKVNAEDKEAVHFIVENGEWSVKLGEYLGQEKIDAEQPGAELPFFLHGKSSVEKSYSAESPRFDLPAGRLPAGLPACDYTPCHAICKMI